MDIVEQDHPIRQHWESLILRQLRELMAFNKIRVNILSCFRLGYYGDGENSITFSVAVNGVDYKRIRSFYNEEDGPFYDGTRSSKFGIS